MARRPSFPVKTRCRSKPLWALMVMAGLLAGCNAQHATTTGTDNADIVIGPKEDVEEPVGMFARLSDKRMQSAISVSYYFTAGTEKMFSDPSLTFRVLSYFEWLVNDVKNEQRIAPFRMAKLVEARNRIRGVIGLPEDTSTQDAVAQFYAMSRFLKAMSSLDRNQSEVIAKRRKIAAQLKARLTRLIQQQQKAGYDPGRAVPSNEEKEPSLAPEFEATPGQQARGPESDVAL